MLGCSVFARTLLRGVIKLRRQLQQKRHIKKIEVFVELSVLQFFHVDWRGTLSLSWDEWLSSDVKAKNERFTAASSRCRQNLRYEDLVLVDYAEKIASKSVPHVQYDYFSFFNQSNHWFVALTLTWKVLSYENLKCLRCDKKGNAARKMFPNEIS